MLDDVLKQIDAVDWVSNIIVAYKYNGAIRICGNVTNVKQTIVINRYHKPIIDKLASFLACSRVFNKINLRYCKRKIKLV